MSTHHLPATTLDDARTVWLLPDADPKADPGWRLRLDKEIGGLAFLAEEQVLPERVDHPQANRVLATARGMWLSTDEARWLHGALGEMLAQEGKRR